MTKAVVVHPALAGETGMRTPEARLEEAVGLAAAINLEVVEATIAPLGRPTPATYLGSGKVSAIRADLDARTPRPGLVIIDCALSPVQHRNLERELDAKVLDRTALILEIFGARARTSEGRLQVELAHLTYQRSRLVRSWTHLERQRGGRGFLGGPGERQIESDRRALANRIDRLKSRLEEVRRTRSLQRARRRRAPYPVVALVGYTNAGKSTLFNRMTASAVFAQDLLFATLDPTMRAADLASGQRIILSDTVGFISELPTNLIAAFRATLEEVLEADVIVHVRDVAHADTEAQRTDVLSVLASLGLGSNVHRPVIEALNKIDLLDPQRRAATRLAARRSLEGQSFSLEEPAEIALSSTTGEGVDELEALIDRLVTADREVFVIEASVAEGRARAFLHEAGDVLIEEPAGETVRYIVRLTEKARGQFQKAFPLATLTADKSVLRRRA